MREENLARLEQALEDLDARRADGEALDLRNLEEPVVELETRAGELKLVTEPAGTRGYDDLRRRADREPLGRGLRPQVASTDDLARMLGALDRDQDLERLLRLRRLMNLEHELSHELGRNPRHRALTDATMTSCVQQLLTPIEGGTQMHFRVQTRLTIAVRVYAEL